MIASPVQMATAADWMSAASFISMAGLIAFFGYGGSVFLMGWNGGYVLMAMLLAPYLRKFGKFTVPEFSGERYYSNGARVVVVICLIIASVTYVIGQMKGIGVAFSRFLEVDYGTGLIVGMAIVFFYAVLGGMKGSPPADGSGTYLLDKLDQMVVELGFTEYTTSKRGSTLNMFVYTFSLMIGTAGLPHVIIRFFTVPKVCDARTSAGWALIFIAILYTTAPGVAAMARLNLMDTIQPAPGMNTEVITIYEAILVIVQVIRAIGLGILSGWAKQKIQGWQGSVSRGRLDRAETQRRNACKKSR